MFGSSRLYEMTQKLSKLQITNINRFMLLYSEHSSSLSNLQNVKDYSMKVRPARRSRAVAWRAQNVDVHPESVGL